jgi:hypothetical protein
MNQEQVISTDHSGPIKIDGAWGRRQPGLLTGEGGENEVKSFNWDVGVKTNEIGTRTESGPQIDCGYEPSPQLRYGETGFAFQDLPSRTGPRPATLRGPLHIQCNGHGDPEHLSKLTSTVLSWPYVETNLPDDNSSNTIPLRLQENATGYNFAAFISPKEFARVLLGAPTIYLALPLVCAHWAIVRGWAEPHYLCYHGLMPPGALVVYTPRDQRELSICFSLFLSAYTAAYEVSNRAGGVNSEDNRWQHC